MDLTPSAISVAALKLRDHLSPPGVTAKQILPPAQILIGNPKSAVDTIGTSNYHYINLFFYHLENAVYPTDVTNYDPFYLKLYILITAFGSDESVDNTSRGEDELRLIGKVLQRFHENPVVRLFNSNSDEIAQLQLVPHTLSLDDINHIWSAQGDVSYRLSVAYEIALVPIPLIEREDKTPRAAEIGVEAVPNLYQEPFPKEGLGITSKPPEVVKTDIDISQPDWTPKICFINKGSCHHTLAFDVESTEFVNFSPKVWVAGDPGEEISLIWEIWKSDGWNRYGSPIAIHPFSPGIDPDNIPPTTSSPDPEFPFQLSLPVSLDIDEYSCQAMLYALRSYTSATSGTRIEVRSNPLLISLYRERPEI